jgi:hypothetical protein
MDERTDVFGLGAILYELVSGRLPYGEEKNPSAIVQRAKAGNVVPIDAATHDIGVSKSIRAIIDRAVAPTPSDRYQSVVELQTAVRGFLRGGLHLPRRAFSPGSTIIREGDAGDEAYMIVSGVCRAFRTVDGRKETLSTMSRGDVFGEMALLLEAPRAASVEAVENVTVLVLDKNTLEEGLGMGGWTGSLVRALAQRFRHLEQQVRDAGIARG